MLCTNLKRRTGHANETCESCVFGGNRTSNFSLPCDAFPMCEYQCTKSTYCTSALKLPAKVYWNVHTQKQQRKHANNFIFWNHRKPEVFGRLLNHMGIELELVLARLRIIQLHCPGVGKTRPTKTWINSYTFFSPSRFKRG